MSGMAQTTSDSILGVIRQESWILDHLEIFVSICLKGNQTTVVAMVLAPGEQHGVESRFF